MRIASFSALSTNGLDHKVNNFLQSNPHIEVIDIKFAASFGSVYASVVYKE